MKTDQEHNEGIATTVAEIGPGNETVILTRDLLRTGDLEQMIERDAPNLRLLTEIERGESLLRTLAKRPAGPLWIFAYGSLIWNPAIRIAETRVARIEGWHRSFCLSVVAGRGSETCPGLVLALDEGGSCDGIAYRIAEDEVPSELPILWRREMVAGSYIPRWLEISSPEGEVFGHALAFTADPANVHYAGHLDVETVVQSLARATGGLGSSAEYLMQTRDGLRRHDIPDPDIETIARLVEAALSMPDHPSKDISF